MYSTLARIILIMDESTLPVFSIAGVCQSSFRPPGSSLHRYTFSLTYTIFNYTFSSISSSISFFNLSLHLYFFHQHLHFLQSLFSSTSISPLSFIFTIYISIIIYIFIINFSPSPIYTKSSILLLSFTSLSFSLLPSLISLSHNHFYQQ